MRSAVQGKHLVLCTMQGLPCQIANAGLSGTRRECYTQCARGACIGVIFDNPLGDYLHGTNYGEEAIPWFLGFWMLTYYQHLEVEMSVASTLSPFDKL